MSDSADLFLRHCGSEGAPESLYLPSWTSDDWRALLSAAAPVTLDSGAVLMRQGDAEGALYFVVDGTLEVSAASGPGAALGNLNRQRSGSVLGEVSFFDGRGRSATVWAIEPTQLLRLDREAFRTFARERPERATELLFGLGRVLAQRLRRGEARQRGQASYY